IFRALSTNLTVLPSVVERNADEGCGVTESIKILYVEDNRGDVDLLNLELAHQSDVLIDTTHAGKLEDAKKLVGKTGFDLILLDLSLPDAEGVETVSEMRRVAPEVTILAYT